jgi:hypothetical protein
MVGLTSDWTIILRPIAVFVTATLGDRNRVLKLVIHHVRRTASVEAMDSTLKPLDAILEPIWDVALNALTQIDQ